MVKLCSLAHSAAESRGGAEASIIGVICLIIVLIAAGLGKGEIDFGSRAGNNLNLCDFFIKIS